MCNTHTKTQDGSLCVTSESERFTGFRNGARTRLGTGTVSAVAGGGWKRVEKKRRTGLRERRSKVPSARCPEITVYAAVRDRRRFTLAEVGSSYQTISRSMIRSEPRYRVPITPDSILLHNGFR